MGTPLKLQGREETGHGKKEGTEGRKLERSSEIEPKELSGVVETRRADGRERERPSQRRASEEVRGTEAKEATELRPKGTGEEGPSGSRRVRQAQEPKGQRGPSKRVQRDYIGSGKRKNQGISGGSSVKGTKIV